ncbi:MAG: glycerophosphodiester phosphodiesterase family protein [Candidatus Lokiarchaeota archaeon]
MNKIYVFGHRGAMGYCMENTMSSFKKAVEFKVGIETDVRLTKDDKLICFHDPVIRVNNKWIKIKDITFERLNSIQLNPKIKIPLIKNVFEKFKDINYDLRYSFDIGSKKAGEKLVRLLRDYRIISKTQINITSYNYLRFLRTKFKFIKLVFTIPHKIVKIKEPKVNFSKLHEFNVHAINLGRNRYLKENFIKVIENGFPCYVWGVNSKLSMKTVINMSHKDQGFSAIYTDYPDILKKLIEKNI